MKLFMVLVLVLITISCGGDNQPLPLAHTLHSEFYSSTNASGTIRGVTFFYLDGGVQDFPWILDHQYDPTVRTRIDNVLSAYKAAGVNWIRLLIATNHFHDRSQLFPRPSTEMTKKVNDFLAIVKDFKIDLVLIPEQTSAGLYIDVEKDKQFYAAWFDTLDFTNIGMIQLSGDLSPCYLDGCYGDARVNPLVNNHGAWIKSIWAWKQSAYPNIMASYEVVGVEQSSNNNPELIKKLVTWGKLNTPGQPVIAAGLYVELPPGSTVKEYAVATNAILDTYAETTSTELWIDEFGYSIILDPVDPSISEVESNISITGFLTSAVCERHNYYPKFVWQAGNDYLGGKSKSNRMFSGFIENQPIPTLQWKTLSYYYNLTKC